MHLTLNEHDDDDDDDDDEIVLWTSPIFNYHFKICDLDYNGILQ